MNVCTVVAKNYLAHARVLAQSFRRVHPDGRCLVLVIDEVDGHVDAAQEPFELLAPADVGLDAFDAMRGAYDVMELSTAVKPWLLRHMLERHDDGSGVAYLDPDIQVLSRMVELEAVLRERAVVLTPHVTGAMPRDGRRPSETDILMAGVYNLGFIGLSGRPDAHRLLDWWAERLLTDCHVAPERGLFVDQRWIDFVPGLVADLAILRHPAYNVAYWNLPERALELRDGAYRVNGEPLRFFHFSGYSPLDPTRLSRHQDRVDLTADETLWGLCDAYADALRAAGHERVRALPYEHGELPSGLRLSGTMRALYRAGSETGECPGSLFTPAGEAEFVSWLNEPAPAAPATSRFLHAVWASRLDLQRAYPGVEHGDAEGFLGWCLVHGREQIEIPDALLPGGVRARRNGAGVNGSGVNGSGAHANGNGNRNGAGAERPFGVNVVGYLRSELGIGEVARQVIGGLDAAAVPALPVGLVAPDSRQGHAFVAGRGDHNPFPVNLVCVNADGLPAFAQQAGPGFFDGRYTIGLWWWETSDFPRRFHDAFAHVDEVWVGSSFVARTLTDALAPVPVVHVPIPVRCSEPPPLRVGEHGWPDAFTYLFSWDYCSVFARKNPLAVVEAYTAAFGPGSGTALVLKCINPGFDPVGHRRLRQAIAGREDVVLIDGYLDPCDKDRLMASCDCYVSLHRSEGLGLTMAEAMFHGKPVVATGYSGNADFMTAENSYPVGYELVPIGEGAAPYAPDGSWAEPDVAQAAQLMRAVFEDRDEAARRGARAAHDIRVRFSAEAAGRAMRARLERIAARAGAGAEEQAAEAAREDVAALACLVSRAGRPDRPSRFGKPGAGLRRLALRTMRPYTAYQQQVNAAVQRTLGSLAARPPADVRVAQLERRTAEAHAQVLAQLRAQRAELADVGAALAREHDARERELRAPAQLVAESRALPYMASEAFGSFDAGPAGAVYGYEHPLGAADGDDAYRAFEELFRGSESFIAARQRRYLEIVGDCAPALDVGCGRGELLDVLAEAGIAATGIDADPGMVARCRAKGHAGTLLGDGVAHLEGCEEGSLGLVFSAQVVEHLPPGDLRRFLAAAARALRPGGLLVAETVNPHSAAAMKAFWVDITHQHPLFPETMLALCRIAGFDAAYVFHPNGVGDVEADRFTTGEYAVVARR